VGFCVFMRLSIVGFCVFMMKMALDVGFEIITAEWKLVPDTTLP